MAFKDLAEFMAPPLELPYKGKTYVIPKPDLDRGLRLTEAITTDGGSLYEATLEVQWRTVLGDAIYDALAADKVPFEVMGRIFVTALADFQVGREAAEGTWEVGSDPEALGAWLKARSQAREASTSTDEEPSTP